jgi:(1->4)-alpha-D-glucan 1-alpha-D-glucosylmutase
LIATYRLQLTPSFGFRAARELVPYLRDLGVSHLYLSPVLKARGGSQHGYDVVDPTRISDELGGEEELRALCASCASMGREVVLDVVPNHMATSDENRFWADRELRAKFFDWDPESGWYRRFFDVGELGGVRVEDDEVFEVTHAKVLELVGDGLVQGLRIDHPDGLADPRGYLERLAARGAQHVWVEKILEPGESLRDWPVEGTTGYEFANDVTALFVDPRGEGPLTDLYEELTGERRPFEEVAHEAKLEQARTTFRQEFDRLRALLDAPGLEEVAAALHVYRTYVEPWSGRVEEADREALAGVPEELRRVLLLEHDPKRPMGTQAQAHVSPGTAEFVSRFQQTTGPVMAKGVEDTAFYRWFRLTALNEVGGNPGRFTLPVEEFHRANVERAARFPLHMLASQTHDTKRSGDVRARISALAGMADEWRERVLAWRELTGGMDDPNEEYLVWQTLVGAWPLERERLDGYLEKALREGKRNTNWLEPNEAHERRVREFVRALYDNERWRADFEPFAERVAREGERISVAQTLLRGTVPGVPDIYQGDELWTLNLVDPDNRRPVDWDVRRRALAELKAGAAPTRETTKLYVLWKALGLRARRPDAFAGAYEPVDAGPDVCAFRRGDVLVAVPLRTGADAAAATGDAGTILEHAPHLILWPHAT